MTLQELYEKHKHDLSMPIVVRTTDADTYDECVLNVKETCEENGCIVLEME
jgi:hypothetical protein